MNAQKQKRVCSYTKSSKTLDSRHKEKIDYFNDNKNNINRIKKELDVLNNKLHTIHNKNKEDITDKEYDDIVTLKDELTKYNIALKNIENNTNEIDYFVETCDILFDYYSILDNNTQKHSLVSIQEHNKKTDNHKKKDDNHKSILDFFKHTETQNDKQNETPDKIVVVKKDCLKNNRALLLDKYLSKTDHNYINNNIEDTDINECCYCKSLNKVYCVNDTLYYCKDCFTVEKVLTDNEKPSYKDPPKEISYFSYKRINHYTELCYSILIYISAQNSRLLVV